MTGLSRIVLIGAGAYWAIGCGSSEPEPNTQFQAGQQAQPYPSQQPYPAQQQPYPAQQPQPDPAQQPAALPTAFPTALPTALPPLALPIPNAPAGSPAQLLDAAMGAAAQPILNNLANSSAPGAKPLGGATVGMFQPGQQLESVVTMQPGKCYTVIAAGLPPVTEVDIQLVASMPIPGMNPVLAQDQTTGPQSVLGQAPNCFKWALPLPGQVKVLTTVTAGQGIAAVQVYEK